MPRFNFIWIALLVGGLSLSLPPAYGQNQAHNNNQSFALDDLMGLLSSRTKFKAKFVEQRHSFFLSKPLILKGRLAFKAPNYLQKEVQSPFQEEIIIDAKAVTVNRRDSIGDDERLDVTIYKFSSYPEIAEAVSAVADIFSGNQKLLTKLYDIKLTGSEPKWQLGLTPRPAKIKKHIESIVALGSAAIINTVIIIYQDGEKDKIALSYAK